MTTCSLFYIIFSVAVKENKCLFFVKIFKEMFVFFVKIFKENVILLYTYKLSFEAKM